MQQSNRGSPTRSPARPRRGQHAGAAARAPLNPMRWSGYCRPNASLAPIPKLGRSGRFHLLICRRASPGLARKPNPLRNDEDRVCARSLALSCSSRRGIGKRQSQDFVVGVRLERFDASVSVPLSGLTLIADMRTSPDRIEASHPLFLRRPMTLRISPVARLAHLHRGPA
jgi:hypothetical protein